VLFDYYVSNEISLGCMQNINCLGLYCVDWKNWCNTIRNIFFL